MKKSIPMLFIIVLFLSSPGLITVSVKAVNTPAEKRTYTVSCSGIGKDWNDCYQEAETLCPDGYKIIKRSTGTVSSPVNGRYTLMPSKEIVIECK